MKKSRQTNAGVFPKLFVDNDLKSALLADGIDDAVADGDFIDIRKSVVEILFVIPAIEELKLGQLPFFTPFGQDFSGGAGSAVGSISGAGNCFCSI